MKDIILLGATGSIGTQVLDLIRENDNYSLKAFSFGKNKEKAKEIIEEFKPKLVSGINASDVRELQQLYPDIEYAIGEIGLQKVASYPVNNPVVINALVGAVGLLPTMVAIECGRDILLANKETLVIGGNLVMSKAKEKNVKIIPIDSEHSAIYQLLDGKNTQDVNKLIVTASGGSFRDKSREELENVTVDEALNHPNWKMGAKITIDSATMMNKGFELIEAHHLFGINVDRIEPILHRESIIHSMVEFNDGSIFAQLGTSDMHLPILYALEGPRHLSSSTLKPLDLISVGTLHFEEVSYDRYPLVKLAIESLKKGSIDCTILNASNEAAVKLFLEGKIKFLDIEQIIIDSLQDPKYEGFRQGEVTISKIMALHEMIYNDICSRYY